MPRLCTGRIASTQHLRSWGSSDGTPVPAMGPPGGWCSESSGSGVWMGTPPPEKPPRPRSESSHFHLLK